MDLPELLNLHYTSDGGYGARARIGLIVLEADQTIEVEVQMVAGRLPGVGFYHTRIPMDVEITPDTLVTMDRRLPEVATLLPPAFGFGAIGYACTSAATVIGTDRVTAAIQTVHAGTPCTNPLSAATAALTEFGAERIALVTPYTDDVTGPIATKLQEAGFIVTAMGSFLEPNDLMVTRISPDSIVSGVAQVTEAANNNGGCDAVFISCTALRTLSILDRLEAESGLSVTSSNQAMIWHLLRLAGIDDRLSGFGSLLR